MLPAALDASILRPMDEMNNQGTSDADCLPHDGHAGHTHNDDCGHASVKHEEHVDYVHDTHRHAEHGGHWDEHSQVATQTGTMVGKPGGVG